MHSRRPQVNTSRRSGRPGERAGEGIASLRPMNAIAVILAAGEGQRMGLPKAMLDNEGKSFLDVLASTFGKGGCGVLAVIGHAAEEVRAQHPRVQLVENPSWRDGQFSSAKAGLQAALDEGAEAVLVHPVDMPAVRASTVKALLSRLASAPAVVPEFEGAPGHPLVLSRAAAEKVLARTDAQTLEQALLGIEVTRVPTRDPGVVVNVNTPEVYERLFGAPPRRAPPPKRKVARSA